MSLVKITRKNGARLFTVKMPVQDAHITFQVTTAQLDDLKDAATSTLIREWLKVIRKVNKREK